jgi:hypothetical protein
MFDELLCRDGLDNGCEFCKSEEEYCCFYMVHRQRLHRLWVGAGIEAVRATKEIAEESWARELTFGIEAACF